MKKIIIPIIIVLILVIGTVSFVLWNNRTVSIITLDINPSIKIYLTRNQKVKSVVALNDDAKEIVSNDLKGKNLDDTIEIITDNLIDKGYVSDDNLLDIILYSNGNISNKEVEKKLNETFNEKNIASNITVIDKVLKEDEELAKKYNISPAKVSYIKSIADDNENISIEDYTNKSVSELVETKETGKYCDKDYTLEGDWCLKEIERTSAIGGEVCPSGYFEENGKCYEEVGGDIKDYCEGNDELVNGSCIETITENAIPQYSCSKGELLKKGDVNPIGAADNDKYYCIDKSAGKAPILRCLTNSGHIMVNGKCYNGPAPTINGGCPNGDLLRNGSCYSLDSYDQYVCPDGHIYNKASMLCPDTLTFTNPTLTGYTCDGENKILNGTKCIYEDVKPVLHKISCQDGFTTNGYGRCINYNKYISKQDGFLCENENARLEGKSCVIYDMVEAKQN